MMDCELVKLIGKVPHQMIVFEQGEFLRFVASYYQVRD